MHTTFRSAAALLLASVVLGGCATSGTGRGGIREAQDAQFAFSWRSDDAVSGQMTAVGSGGGQLAGKYFQITGTTQLDQLNPLWDGWGPAQRGWPYWYTQPDPRFLQHYAGLVLANLSTADGEPMWCSLRLREPSAGMAGGGAGVCQLRSGTTIDATFPRRFGANAGR